MIDTAEETTCLACGAPIIQIGGRGHRKRLYCDDRCRQRAHRAKEQGNVTSVMHDATLQARIVELEQELTRYRHLADMLDRAKREARFMVLGEQTEYHDLMDFAVFGGYSYWHSFMNRSKDETLLRAIATAENYLEGLIALREDPRQRDLDELSRQVKDLQARLDIEQRYREDTRVRHFKSWLRRRPRPQDADFLKLFLEDSRLPHHASRSMYIARLKQYGYTAEDIALFEEAWKDMLFDQS